MSGYILREERWEKGRQRVGFMVVRIAGPSYLEVFRQTGRKRTRVHRCRLASGDRTGKWPSQAVAAAFHANGFRPQQIWVEGELRGPPSSIFYETEPRNDYTVSEDDE